MTITDARRNADTEIDVITVFDGQPHRPEIAELSNEVVVLQKPRGTSRARHEGVMRAKTALIVTCDAHMRFAPGWAREWSSWYGDRARRKTVSCGCIGSLDEHGEKGGDETTYHGAQFFLRDRNVQNNEHYALSAKWRGENMPGEQISCVMGAFYAFRRAWYADMGEPWACGTAWGMDEETISASSWLAGGEVRLAPAQIRAWHFFYAFQHFQKTNQAYVPDDQHYPGIWLNRFRMVAAMPMPQELKDELQDWQARSKWPMIAPAFDDMHRRDMARTEVQNWVKTIAGGNWSDFAARWIAEPSLEATTTPTPEPVAQAMPYNPPVTPSTAPCTPRKISSKVIHRMREICYMCDSLESYKVYCVKGDVQYLRCRICGANARRMNHGPAEKHIECD
jgi:hypothetical protein